MVSKFRTPLAFIVSACWLILIWHFVVAPKGGLEHILSKELNEVGDFFAGAFAPLAFLWFVVAYWQQSDELRETRKELQRQADSIAANELHARKDTFFRLIEVLLVEQNAIIARIMSGACSLDTELTWQRFGEGNKDAFFNAFIRSVILRYDAIRSNRLDRFAEDRFIFDKNSEKFMQNFEVICEKAGECAADLRLMFETGAMGRAYKGMCFILGKPQKVSVSPQLTSLGELKS